MSLPRFPIFLSTAPGLEPVLLEEAKSLGWTAAKETPGGVEISGSWPDIWRANLLLRTANRVLVRLGTFRAQQLNILHGKAAELPWTEFLKPEQPFTVEATSRKSKIYHTGAAEERVAKAVATVSGADPSVGGLKVFVRIESNLVTISIDSSGTLLHQRGFKADVAGAPIRETLAAAFLRQCGYSGEEPVVDPFCGSGTILLEAADIAAGLPPGRARTFAFEHFASFNPQAYDRARTKALARDKEPSVHLYGSDRSSGAIKASVANTKRAGTNGFCMFSEVTVSELKAPEGPPGLVLTNPPYGSRLGDKSDLESLYKAFGAAMRERFASWRIGLITADESLAKATGLRLAPGPFIPHGGLKIRLWQGEA